MFLHMKTGVEQSVYAILLLTFFYLKKLCCQEMSSALSLGVRLRIFKSFFASWLALIYLLPFLVAKVVSLKKTPEEIRIYDVYVAIEGKQSLYSSSGIFHDMLNLKDKDICLLSDLMEEAESSWQSILKRQTIATLTNEINKKCPKENLDIVKSNSRRKKWCCSTQGRSSWKT